MKTRVILFLLLAAVAASAAWLLLRDGDTDAPTARILRDGVLLEEIDLDRVAEPYSFTLEDGSGANTVQVERGRIRISAADCPDQVCVKQGWISGGAVPIICLPHTLMIEIVSGGGALEGAAGEGGGEDYPPGPAHRPHVPPCQPDPREGTRPAGHCTDPVRLYFDRLPRRPGGRIPAGRLRSRPGHCHLHQ